MFAPDVLPDSEAGLSPGRLSSTGWSSTTLGVSADLQRTRNGQRWHGDFDFDFDRQAADVRELKGWELETNHDSFSVGLSPGRVSQSSIPRVFNC